MKRGQPELPFRNQSATTSPAGRPVTPPRVRVPAPQPVFASAAEVKAYQSAVATVTREEGESLIGWLTRVAAKAGETL